MNIFVVDEDPRVAAKSLCDKHVVKMIVESGQMLSTTHRVLDGVEWTDRGKNNRRIKRWRVSDEREDYLWKASFVKHPCTVWTMQNATNYTWHWLHAVELCEEYTRRYNKTHSSEGLIRKLERTPDSISNMDYDITPFAQAMPDEYKVVGDAVSAYRKYYNGEKTGFAKWTNRNQPEWFGVSNVEDTCSV